MFLPPFPPATRTEDCPPQTVSLHRSQNSIRVAFIWLLFFLGQLFALEADTAAASLRHVKIPQEANVPLEITEAVFRIISTNPEANEMTVALRGETLNVSVARCAAEIFKKDTLVRGFLTPSTAAKQVLALENIWPADPWVLNAQKNGLKALTARLQTPAFRVGSGFQLPLEGFLDHRANVLSETSFQGKQVVLNFIYGRCAEPAMCPATAARMTRLRENLPSTAREKVEILFMTLDPSFDTPARCLEYLRARNLDVPGVSMLTGSVEAVEALSKLCGLWLKKLTDGVIEHSQITIWSDATGTVREAFPSSDSGAASLERALLLETAQFVNPAGR